MWFFTVHWCKFRFSCNHLYDMMIHCFITFWWKKSLFSNFSKDFPIKYKSLSVISLLKSLHSLHVIRLHAMMLKNIMDRGFANARSSLNLVNWNSKVLFKYFMNCFDIHLWSLIITTHMTPSFLKPLWSFRTFTEQIYFFWLFCKNSNCDSNSVNNSKNKLN